MKKVIIGLAMLFIAMVVKAQTFHPLLAAMLQDTLDAYVSQIPSIKGMSASVFIPGQGIWTGVKGNSFTGQPITKDMRFGIASNSKLFVAVMILKLAERITLSLDDSLKDWISIANPNINPNITVKQLLNHSSGISDPFFAAPWFDTINLNPKRVFTPHEVLNWVGTPLFSAGTSYSYSNTNYVLASLVAESASGRSLSNLIRDSILTPLHLDSTFIDVEETANGLIAHRWWNNIDYHDTSRVGLNSAVGYAGSIFSTASEMVQWYQALFSGQVINTNSMQALTTFIATTNPSYQYGLGLSSDITQGYKYWGHGGRTWGYKSKMMYDSCLKVSVAGLTNSDPSGVDAVTFLLYRVVKNHIPGCCGVITGPVSICEESNPIVFSVAPIPNASSYQWTLPSGVLGSSNTNSIIVNVPKGASSGEVKVTGVNSYGVGGSTSIWLNVQPKPAAPIISRNGAMLISNSVLGNQWHHSFGAIPGANNQTYTPIQEDMYYTIVTQAGCSSDTSNKVDFKLTKLPEISESIGLQIVPNPFSAHTTFYFDRHLNNANITLCNVLGQVMVLQTNFYGNTLVFERNGLAAGLYFIQVSDENLQSLSTRLVLVE